MTKLWDGWEDFDVAAFRVAGALGLMPTDLAFFRGPAKHVFWSHHPLGEALNTLLAQLLTQTILERNDEDQLRWNPNYRGTWEQDG